MACDPAPAAEQATGVPRVDDCRVLNGIFWRSRTAAPWADIPERYGPHTTCGNRFNRWRKAGVWSASASCVKGLRRRYPDDRLLVDPRPSVSRQRQKKTTDPVAWVARGSGQPPRSTPWATLKACPSRSRSPRPRPTTAAAPLTRLAPCSPATPCAETEPTTATPCVKP